MALAVWLPSTSGLALRPKASTSTYKLSSKNPEYKNQHLGKAGSEKYRDWRARIQRREATLAVTAKPRAEMGQQLSMLQALIDRQTTVILDLAQNNQGVS
ncbi:hypothetical protein BST81_02395 [Leptolyngbya sp. 'hensonii']|nr:hypothetical protein BST81_02395 [Leptolyngbya sp. 'hensonii']